MSRAAVSWRDVPETIRSLARWAMIVNATGYVVALAFVRHTTGLTAAGAAARYRGAEPSAGAPMDLPMTFPKPVAEMLLSTHTHLLGMAALFVVSGLCLALCSRPSGRWKRFLVIEPFVATLVSFAALWLMRYVDGRFAWLLFASSASMAAVFGSQTVIVLRELHRVDREAAASRPAPMS